MNIFSVLPKEEEVQFNKKQKLLQHTNEEEF